MTGPEDQGAGWLSRHARDCDLVLSAGYSGPCSCGGVTLQLAPETARGLRTLLAGLNLLDYARRPSLYRLGEAEGAAVSAAGLAVLDDLARVLDGGPGSARPG